MKLGILRNSVAQKSSRAEKLISLGENSGNLVFWEALDKLFLPETVSYSDREKIKSCDKMIVTDLIWIRQNSDFCYLEKIVDENPVPFVPISIGLQSEKFDARFKIPASVVRLLHKLEERAMLGVRGEYTADILRKHGVRNFAVIGCPSMYYWKDPDHKISTVPRNGKTSCNFRSFCGQLSVPEKHFLSYCASHGMQFIEQTKWRLSLEQTKDAAYYEYVRAWLDKNTESPLDCDEWRNMLSDVTFSIGGRFHGNVMALWCGIPSLFLTVDSRTAELTDYFCLPSVPMSSFRKDLPLQYYRELADYASFNERYPQLYKNFQTFAEKNGLKIADASTAKTDQIAAGPIGAAGRYGYVRLNEIKKEGGKLSFDFCAQGKIADYILNKRSFTVEYDCGIEKVPDSVAAIPFMTLMLPVCWVTDCTLIAEEADEDFVACLDAVRRSYKAMYPQTDFRGDMQIKKILKNCIDYSLRRTMCFFSGGVDATSTLLTNLCYRPTVFMVWGTDIYFDQKEAWEKSSLLSKRTASEFQLPFSYVKSSFRDILDEKKLTWDYARQAKENWWHGFEHGIALLGHAAPFALVNDVTDIKIAATYSAKDPVLQTCASYPSIDETLSFCGCRIYHDGFGKSRLDKVRQIVQFMKKTGKKINLRVCWEQITGENCCICEKCARTIFGIYAAGGDPEDFGFHLTEEKKKKISDNIKKDIYRNIFWEEPICALRESKDDFVKNELVLALLDKYSKSGVK